MIEKFNDWFEGTWENKVQAFSQPSKFAMVRLIHKKVPGTDYMYYGEQAYNFSLSRPYRPPQTCVVVPTRYPLSTTR